MITLRRFQSPLAGVPPATAWYLSDLGEAKGRQELHTRQSPQKLKALREHALIESAVSSNRIEGVEIDPARVRPVLFGKAALRDRNEEEVRGYRTALDLIHTRGAKLPITEATVRRLHALARGGVGDAGRYKTTENDVIERFPSGRREVRFRTVRAAATPEAMNELIENWAAVIGTRSVHPLLALGAFNLDFLCIHPFRDGNGRTSRLLFLLQCYHLGFEVGRFVSLERLVEQHKERYYEVLKLSSAGWHNDRHDPWPAINYFLYTLLDAYREFERRVGDIASPRGEKTALVLSAIRSLSNPFRAAEIQRLCPGVSIDMVRHVLKRLQDDGKVRCLNRGHQAQWERISSQFGNS
jgi:Fic family protein